MITDGLVEEARKVIAYRHTNALNTVGYKEIFKYIDGSWTLETAVEKIKQNTRIYSRKQMTWFRRDESIHWFHPDETEAIKKTHRKKRLCHKLFSKFAPIKHHSTYISQIT